MLTGSMGLLPSASLAGIPVVGGRAPGLYEPIHGTAPDIAGKGVANPSAAILSVALMMRYSLGLTEEAAIVERAVDRAIEEGCRTPDIAPPPGAEGPEVTRLVGTVEMGDAVAAAI